MFSIERKKIIEKLSLVSGVVGLKSPREILRQVLFVVGQEKIVLKGTNLENSIVTELEPISVSNAEMFTISPVKLLEILKLLKEEVISFKLKGDTSLFIDAGSGVFELATGHAEDFPKIPEINPEQELVIEGSELKKAFNYTEYSTSSETHRYAMTGIQFNFESDNITFVTTDAKRMTVYHSSIKTPSSLASSKQKKGGNNIVVPKMALANFIKSITDVTKAVNIGIKDNMIKFTYNKDQLFATLLEGEIPDYKSIIPAEYKNTAELERTNSIDAVKKILVTAIDKEKEMELILSSEGIQFISETPTIGKSEVEVKGNYKGSNMSLLINPIYLLDPMKVLSEENVKILLNGDESPFLITNTEGTFKSLIMPLEKMKEAE